MLVAVSRPDRVLVAPFHWLALQGPDSATRLKDGTAVTDGTQTDAEGTIQFAYGLGAPIDFELPEPLFATLRAWRRVLCKLELVGRDPERYGGLGFGNLSVREPDQPTRFIITASQTSGARDLYRSDLVRIMACSLDRFWVEAEGSKPPSSETLSHAMIYAADPRVDCVLHAHSPVLWRRAADLGLACTAPDVPYGSPAMAAAVAELLGRDHDRPLVFITDGHEDGVFACGADPDATGTALVAALARALRA